MVDDTIGEVKAGDDAADACFADISMEHRGTRNEVIEGKDKSIDSYVLRLTSEEKGFALEATVERIQNVQGLLKETKFRVVANKGIAFDHPRFVVEALLYVEKCLQETK